MWNWILTPHYILFAVKRVFTWLHSLIHVNLKSSTRSPPHHHHHHHHHQSYFVKTHFSHVNHQFDNLIPNKTWLLKQITTVKTFKLGHWQTSVFPRSNKLQTSHSLACRGHVAFALLHTQDAKIFSRDWSRTTGVQRDEQSFHLIAGMY